MRQFTTLFKNKAQAEVTDLCNELLSPAEQIMLIKRVAIIMMLKDNVSTFEIARTLKVSATTVGAHRKQLAAGKYDTVIETIFGRSFNQQKFWQVVDTILRAGLPPMAGAGRWQGVAAAPMRSTRSRPQSK